MPWIYQTRIIKEDSRPVSVYILQISGSLQTLASRGLSTITLEDIKTF